VGAGEDLAHATGADQAIDAVLATDHAPDAG
jgi:hypothetical protein